MSEVGELNIITLNCWSIPLPIVCQNRAERMQAIAAHLSKSNYDIVFLQEVWSLEDYKKICHVTLLNLPYTHYFHSGLNGSGLCVFSKHYIIEAMFHRFHLNGFAHKIHHADWFGGKGIGLCKVDHKEFGIINCYISHFHAEYNLNDEYLAHRTAQAYEAMQFMRHTSNPNQLTIAGGDFNLEPHHVGYKLLISGADLSDAWLSKNPGDIDSTGGFTSDIPTNSYAAQSALSLFPNGKRIDYIFFRESSNFNLECDSCELAMRKIPGLEINYSDHEAVNAKFLVRKSFTEEPKKEFEDSVNLYPRPGDVKMFLKILDEAMLIFSKHLADIGGKFSFYITLLFILLLLLSIPYFHFFHTYITVLLVILLTFYAVFRILTFVYIMTIEANTLTSIIEEMSILRHHLRGKEF